RVVSPPRSPLRRVALPSGDAARGRPRALRAESEVPHRRARRAAEIPRHHHLGVPRAARRGDARAARRGLRGGGGAGALGLRRLRPRPARDRPRTRALRAAEMSESVSRLARRFGLSRTALLYYDRLGLLSPSERSAAGDRLYGAA